MRSLNDIKNKTDRLGRKQGLWEYYYPNGQLHIKGSYVSGEKDGIWEYYYSDGDLDFKVLFENGKFIEYVI
jgi:antitoxin component YwqK of YwqJK toxin-antitoxin module